MPLIPEVNTEELEDGATPVYLLESNIYRAYMREKRRQAADALMATSVAKKQEKVKVEPPKWKVAEEKDPNDWRINNLDDE